MRQIRLLPEPQNLTVFKFICFCCLTSIMKNAVFTFQLSLQILTQSFSFDPGISLLGVLDTILEFAVWDGLAFTGWPL